MATKTVTYCDITHELCHQTFRIGMSDGTVDYMLELSANGVQMFLGELISGIDPDALDGILVRLVGSNWKETLNR